MDKPVNSKRKWWIGIPVFIIALILICILLIPTYLSSNSGKRFIINLVEKNTGGDLEIGDLSLGWFQDQQIKILQFSDDKGGQIIFNKLTSDLSFWNLLMRSGSIGTTHIESPKVTFSPKEPKEWAPTEKTSSDKKKKKESFWSNFRGHLIVSNGAITLKKGMAIDNLSLDINMPKSSKIEAIELHGRTQQNGVSGNFNAKGKMGKWFEGTANVNNLPVEGLDRIFSGLYPAYQGLLLESLGDSVNAQIDSSGSGDILFSLRSPRLFIDLSPKYTGNQFILNHGGRFAWTVKPAVFNHFSSDALLQNDAQGELRLDSATLPFNKKLDFSSLAAMGTLSFTDGNFLLKKINESIGVKSFVAHFSTKKLKELLSLNIDSNFNYKENGNSGLRGTTSIQNALEKTFLFPAIDLNIDNLPLALIDSWNKGSLSKYLGATFSGKIQKSNEQFNFSGRTPLFQFTDTMLIISDRARLTSPSTFSYLVQPTLYENLTHPFNLNGTLKALSVPLKEEALLFSESNFDLDFKTEKMDFKDLFSLGSAFFPSFAASLKGNSLEAIEFNGNGQLNFPGGSLGASILGTALSLYTNGTINTGDEIEITPLNITLDGKKFKGSIEAAIEKNLFILRNALKADFLLEPDQINPILSKENEFPLLSKATPFHIEIKPSQIPLKGADSGVLSLKGNGSINSLSMINPSNRYPFEFRDVELDFDLNGKKGAHTIHFEGNALEENAAGGKLDLTLSGKGKASDLVSKPKKIKASLSNFSSQIADVLFKTRGQLPDMIGKTLDLKYEMEKVGNNQNIDIFISSPNLDLDGSFVVAGKMLELRSPRKPLKIRWDISEKAFDAFRRWRHAGNPLISNNSLFEIEEAGSLKIQVAPFSIPLKNQGEGFPKPDFSMYASRFNANMRIDDLRLKERRSGTLTKLKAFDLDIAKPNIGNTPLTFKFEGNVSPYEKGGRGKIQGTGKMEDFLSSTGSLDFSNVTTSIHAQIKNLPSIFIDALSKLDTSSTFPPSAFLGDLFNANFDAEVKKSQGKVMMDIDATACKALFSGIISDEVLYLHEPLKAVFTVTPQLNDVLDKGADLIVIAMEKPITLYIHDKGFAVPLKNLHIRNMSFNYGQLDLGQIVCKNVGSAEEVGGLFKMDHTGNISVWFAPCEFNMKEGKMYVGRTEILYNRVYQVCLWGKVKFPSRKVDMTLGLTAQALRAALGIQGINDDYVLKVPVKGPFGKVKIDTGSATGKIAFLVARKHLAPKTGIFGQVLGAVGDLADDQSDVPPPKIPFPWQEQN